MTPLKWVICKDILGNKIAYCDTLKIQIDYQGKGHLEWYSEGIIQELSYNIDSMIKRSIGEMENLIKDIKNKLNENSIENWDLAELRRCNDLLQNPHIQSLTEITTLKPIFKKELFRRIMEAK